MNEENNDKDLTISCATSTLKAASPFNKSHIAFKEYITHSKGGVTFIKVLW